jgi:hypothetical protein
MPTGWMSPLPIRLGGGATRIERYYRGLRSAIGDGGAGPPGGLEDVWRMIEARAIGASYDACARAAHQMWPQTMTDLLDGWEAKLGLPRAPTLVERQAVVRLALIRELDASLPAMRIELQDIDPNLDIENVDWTEEPMTQFGRAFGPLPGVSDLAYGTGRNAGRVASAWPNWSFGFLVRVRYQLPAGETLIPVASRARAEDYLNEVLPAWVDFELYNLADGSDGLGFYLEGGPNGDSLLDQTAFGH